MCDFSGKTLLVLGDSIMYGSGNGGKGVGEYLGERFGFILKKYCVGGARVGYYEGKNWLVEQVRSAILDGISPDYIIFDGFTNDCNMTDGKSLFNGKLFRRHAGVAFGRALKNSTFFPLKKKIRLFHIALNV